VLTPLIDPRSGDLEDDFSSTKRRSLLGIAGSLLAEISFPKLIVAWALLIVLPGLILGIAPLITTAWLATVVRKAGAPFNELWPLFVLPFVLLLGWIGWRPLFRVAEQAFWSLNSLAVQPGYALCREALQHLAERLPIFRDRHTQLRAWTAVGAGVLVCAWGLGIVFLAWSYSRWMGAVADLATPQQLLLAALANAAVALGAYLSIAGPVWGIADASMRQPRDLVAFDPAPGGSARGALPTSRTCTVWASGTAFALKAVDRARKATIDCQTFWRGCTLFIPSGRWISCLSPET
jgi:hypothetical protein